ncbi:Uncharacterized protein Rs2_21724 [Raphanus sativus]|nr:Uncharacterized protein Rs2_21724 [Raphanus sativus]
MSHDIPPESYHPPPQGYPWAPPPHQEGNTPPPPLSCDHEAQYQFYFVGNYRYLGRTPPTQPLKLYKHYQQDHYQDSNSGGSSFLRGWFVSPFPAINFTIFIYQNHCSV